MSEKVKLTAFLVQVFSTVIIGSLTSLTGYVFAWPSYTLEIYKSNATVLDEPISTAQESMLGSIVNVGALIATPFSGYAVDKFGRKYSAMLFGLPYVISWILISNTTSFYVVLFAVGVAGFGAAGQAVSSVYIAEISQNSIRGALTSSTAYLYFFGLLSSYTFGGYMSYYNVLYIHLALSILYIILLTFLKESACYLLKCGKEKEAAESIAFYRRLDVKSKEVEFEIKKLKLQFQTNKDIIKEAKSADSQASVELLAIKSQESDQKTVTTWQFLRGSESSQRGLVAVFILISTSSFMGSVVLQVYAESLFKVAVPTMHSNTCSIFLALVYLIAALVCASTLDKFGRKSLMTITSILSGIFTMLIGTQLHLRWAPHWFTAFAIYGYGFVYNIGASIVPYVVAAEIFLPEIRGFANSFSLAIMWITNWIILVVFTPLVEFCGLGPTFYVFAVFCLLAAAYSHFCLPETKGLSSDEIQILFMKKGKKPLSRSPDHGY